MYIMYIYAHSEYTHMYIYMYTHVLAEPMGLRQKLRLPFIELLKIGDVFQSLVSKKTSLCH